MSREVFINFFVIIFRIAAQSSMDGHHDICSTPSICTIYSVFQPVTVVDEPSVLNLHLCSKFHYWIILINNKHADISPILSTTKDKTTTTIKSGPPFLLSFAKDLLKSVMLLSSIFSSHSLKSNPIRHLLLLLQCKWSPTTTI